MNKIKIFLICTNVIMYIIVYNLNVLKFEDDFSNIGIIVSYLYLLLVMGTYFYFGYYDSHKFIIVQAVMVSLVFLTYMMVIILSFFDLTNAILIFLYVLCIAPFLRALASLPSFDFSPVMNNIVYLIIIIIYFTICNILYFFGRKYSYSD